MGRRGMGAAAVLLTAGLALAAAGLGPVQAKPSASRAPTGVVYLVQALPDTAVTLSVDGSDQRQDVQSGAIIGPLDLAPGKHTLTAAGTEPEWTMNASFTVPSKASTDVVLHRPAAVRGEPTVTVYRNPLAAVPRGTGRVRVAHTATVPPADVRVDGRVVFANIANGEYATAEVPAGPHQVAVVPTGQRRPAMLGPVELVAKPATLTQVFAVGRPQNNSMNVVVQQLPLPTRGSAAPEQVNTGSAGLVADLPVADFRMAGRSVTVATRPAPGPAVPVRSAALRSQPCCSSVSRAAPGTGRLGRVHRATGRASATGRTDGGGDRWHGRRGAVGDPRLPAHSLVRLPSGAAVPVRVARTGAGGLLRVPDDIRAAGWWDGGARVGAAYGAMVVAGHVDSRSQGLGPFAELLGVRRGHRVDVRATEAAPVVHRRAGSTWCRRSPSTPAGGIFTGSGPLRLVLITCAGTYDPQRGGYQDLAVVTATPIGRAVEIGRR